MLTIEDEYTLECLAIEVERSITSTDVIGTLRYLFEIRGVPRHLCSNDGPVFIAKALRSRLKEAGVETLYIEPSAPWENGINESLNSRFLDELLNGELFTNLKESKVVTEDYRLAYNHHRPHSSLGYRTPAESAALCRDETSPTLIAAGTL